MSLNNSGLHVMMKRMIWILDIKFATLNFFFFFFSKLIIGDEMMMMMMMRMIKGQSTLG